MNHPRRVPRSGAHGRRVLVLRVGGRGERGRRRRAQCASVEGEGAENGRYADFETALISLSSSRSASASTIGRAASSRRPRCVLAVIEISDDLAWVTADVT